MTYSVNQCKGCKDGEICVDNRCEPDPNHYSARDHLQVCPGDCDTKVCNKLNQPRSKDCWKYNEVNKIYFSEARDRILFDPFGD